MNEELTREKHQTILGRPGHVGNTAGVIIEQLAPDGLLVDIPHNHMAGSSAGAENMTDLRIPRNTTHQYNINAKLLCDFGGVDARLCKSCNLRMEHVGYIDEMNRPVVTADTHLFPLIMAIKTDGLNSGFHNLQRSNLLVTVHFNLNTFSSSHVFSSFK